MILFLNIKKKYFDAILRGDKKTEYRKLSPFYRSRIENKNIEAVHLRNGYSCDSPEALVEVLGVDHNSYHPEIGKSYGLQLGDIIEVANKNS